MSPRAPRWPRAIVTVQDVESACVSAAQRRGVGSGSCGGGTRSSRQGHDVFLEGNPAYYSRLASSLTGSLGYAAIVRIPEPGFRDESPGHEAMVTGTLVYSHIFWDHDVVGLRDAD